MWRLDADPRFTRDVVARRLLQTPLTLLDVGARGGIAEHWSVFGDQLDVVAIEPAEGEPGLAAFLSSKQGTATFHHRPFAASSGLYRTGELFTGTVLEPIFGTVGRVLVPTRRSSTCSGRSGCAVSTS